MATQLKQIILDARALLEQSDWTQGVFARKASGDTVPFRDYEASAFCAMGAIRKVANIPDHAEQFPCDGCDREGILDLAVGNLSRAQFGVSLVAYNDEPGRTKEEVLEAMSTLATIAPEDLLV